MNILNRIKLTIAESRRIEDLAAKQAVISANLDYIAIMADIDLSMEGEENE